MLPALTPPLCQREDFYGGKERSRPSLISKCALPARLKTWGGLVIKGDMRVVRKLTRVMKTQWNYNKPIAKLIRSPGRRPFNNKTRSYGSRSRSHPRSRPTPLYIHMCVCVRKRINFSRAFMLSDRPNCAHTHTHIYTRFQTRRWFGCSTPARRFDVSTCAGTSRNTHTLRNVRGRGVRMYVRTVAKIRFDHAA